MRAGIAAAALASLLVLGISAGQLQGQSSDVRVVQLSCEANPEVVTIENLGDAAQSLSGWKLRSDPVSQAGQVFDLSAVGTLSPKEQASIFSGTNAPETDAGANQFRWALSFKFRNDDPSDFAQIVNDENILIDQLNCEQQPDPTPTTPVPPTTTPTPVPTVVPGIDTDGDGCTDEQEVGLFPSLGGLRDPLSFWDFFDVPTASARDRRVDGFDIGAVVLRFGTFVEPPPTKEEAFAQALMPPPDLTSYHPAFDRESPVLGENVWNVRPPDGRIDGFDISFIVVQFGHTCAGAPAARLQVHHIDVEQGDAAIIISPRGQVAMVDDGGTNCSNTVSYLQSLNITSIDFHFASHYHADHIGCLDDLAAAGIAVATACYDRGGTFGSATFDDYAATCGASRQTLVQGQVITLDPGAPMPVTITVVDLNGAGIGTSEENALSLVLRLSYGAFDEVLAGDLNGTSPDDVESVVGPAVGDVEVYKVNHHGSSFSSNDAWLDATSPEVGIVSVGSNGFGHPTEEAMGRLHSHGVQTYWTNEGSGASPDPAFDQVAGTVVIEAAPGLSEGYTVSGTGFTDSYANH